MSVLSLSDVQGLVKKRNNSKDFIKKYKENHKSYIFFICMIKYHCFDERV